MTDNNTQAAIDAGLALAKAFDINGTPAVMKPAGASVELFEQLRALPMRSKVDFTALTATAFIDYYKQFATSDSVIVYSTQSGLFKAVIDYHTAQSPDWCQHVMTYTCQQSEEWKSWMASNARDMDQESFAAFIENYQTDIQNPPAAEMMEIARSLQANTDVKFRSAVRLDNGQVQFAYNEVVNGQAGETGQLAIPQIITLGLRPFVGGPAYRVEARFRYRIKDAKLVMRYELVRPHRIIEDAVAALVVDIKEQTAATQVYEATL